MWLYTWLHFRGNIVLLTPFKLIFYYIYLTALVTSYFTDYRTYDEFIKYNVLLKIKPVVSLFFGLWHMHHRRERLWAVNNSPL